MISHNLNYQCIGKISILLSVCVLLVFSESASAHERWILSVEQIDQWNALPKPGLFTQLSSFNLTMIAVFLLFIVGWVRLGFTGARELFPDLQARLSSYGDHVPRILRVCLAWVLLSSAFGAEPRFGIDPFTTPTLFAPDLDLQSLGPLWAWLRWAEVVLALTILFGIYVRFFAGLLIALSLLGFWLYGEAMLAYAGALIGASIYLILQGAGRHYLPLPVPASLQGLQSWLADQPRQRAQAIMRILTGTTLLYLGIVFKLLQPNLAIGIVTIYNVPILSAAPEIFALLMALVEVSSGILIIAGVLLRPLSLFLICAFSIFSVLLPETITAHILFYGVILSCFINSAGHLRRPIPRDKTAHIVIIGGGLAALHAAIKIENIIGQYSNVAITLFHDQSNYLFMPLLPEVIGGTVQPGNVVNPIRRVIQRVNVVVGRLDTIDEKNNVVKGVRKNGEKIELNYDSLILAPSSKSSFSTIPGMITHGYPIDTVGDALRIRQRVIDLVEEAEFSDHVDEKKRLLTFVIVGSGETASAVAVEVCQMLLTAESSYPVLRESNWQVHLYEDTEHNDSDFEKQTSEMRTSCLEKAGVILHKDDKITNISQTDIIFDKSNYLPVGLVVNAAFVYPSVPFLYSGIINLPFSITDNLNLINHKNIWITEVNSTSKNPQHLFINDRIALGSTAGYNAWASSQGFTPHPYIQKKHIIKPYNMRHHSICYVGGIGFSGNLAWFVSRLINLLSVPGLERNLRILIDWLLVIPFRNDIAILAQATSYKLQRTQYKKGDEIYRQDDLAEHAYAVETGRLEVIQDGRKTKELAPGDYFGEILSLHLGRREETVRCLSPSELTVVAQEDFKALTQGGSLMGKAMRNLAEYRSTESSEEDTLGLKRITYVSKLNAPLNEADILEIGRLASLNNRKIDVTGILISVHGYFFQILEGEESIVDKLVEKISRDNRHAELTILSAESECEEHIFSEWSMKTVALSESKDHMLQAISIMLQNIAQSHSAIGHYTQPIIFKFLTEGINPLTIPVKSTKKIVLSGSMIDFSNLFEQFHYEDVVQAINTYLETCSASIIQHGGQIAKYSGDSVIAHFSLKQTDAAIAACMDISRKMTVLKKNSAIFSLIHFHYGIISGAMIEGNIGSSIKMDYTVLGSTIHRAVRLGMVARETNNAIAISENIQQMADPSWGFQYAGEFLLNQQGELSRRLSEN